MYDAISAHCTTRPHNIPPEVLSHIMTFVRDDDVLACVYTNSSFYLAAKPHLYRTVALDQYFHVHGAEHPLADLDVPATPSTRRRALFRRAWMTRVCHTLEVETHHESYCSCAVAHHSGTNPSDQPLLPPLPRLRTLHLPFDVHGTLRNHEEPAPCGLHALQPAHLIQHGLYWTSRQPATTNMSGLQSFTANIASHELWNPDRRSLHLQLPGMEPGARLTLIAPLPTGYPLPPQCATFRDPACLASLARGSGRERLEFYPTTCQSIRCPHHLLLKVARAVAHAPFGPRVRLVGFEVACSDRGLPVYRHLTWLMRAFWDAFAEEATLEGNKEEAEAWRARKGGVDPFLLINLTWWYESNYGQKTVAPGYRMVENWTFLGYPRSVSRLARDQGTGAIVKVKGQGMVTEPYWLPEPERDWCLVDEE
jgi:hypothetical protein